MKFSTVALVVGCMGLLFTIFVFIPYYNDLEIVKGDCYDQRNNKMIGIDCEMRDTGIEYYLMSFFAIVSMLLLLIGLVEKLFGEVIK